MEQRENNSKIRDNQKSSAAWILSIVQIIFGRAPAKSFEFFGLDLAWLGVLAFALLVLGLKSVVVLVLRKSQEDLCEKSKAHSLNDETQVAYKCRIQMVRGIPAPRLFARWIDRSG